MAMAKYTVSPRKAGGRCGRLFLEMGLAMWGTRRRQQGSKGTMFAQVAEQGLRQQGGYLSACKSFKFRR